MDIGTSNTGVVFRLRSKDDIFAVDSGEADTKFPTRLVLENTPPHNCLAFGSGAVDALLQSQGNASVFRNFKVELANNPNLLIKAEVGDLRLPLRQVMAHLMRKLVAMLNSTLVNNYNVVITELMSATGTDTASSYKLCIPLRRIRWLVTVPAIWSDKAKQCMRQAALDAGMITTEASEKLLIVLEPECAAVQVVKELGYLHKRESKFGIFDFGGGTVDGSFYQVLSDDGDEKLQMAELYKSGGGLWGGKHVDDSMILFLEELLGYAIDPLDKFELLTTYWETTKKNFTFERYQRGDSCSLSIGTVLNSRPAGAQPLVERIRVYLASHPEHKGLGTGPGAMNRLNLPASLMYSFFKDSFINIRLYLQKMLSVLPDLNFVIGVGGFCASTLLRQEIKDVCAHHKIPARFPANPQVAIVEGAAQLARHLSNFGNENPVVERVMRLSYGVETTARADHGTHKSGNIFFDTFEQAFIAEKVFHHIVHAGARVKINQEMVVPFKPRYEGQDFVNINVYQSEEANVIHTNSVGCKLLGSIRVPLRANDGAAVTASAWHTPAAAAAASAAVASPAVSSATATDQQQIIVKLIFGLPELIVTVEHVGSGHTRRQAMDYSNGEIIKYSNS